MVYIKYQIVFSMNDLTFNLESIYRILWLQIFQWQYSYRNGVCVCVFGTMMLLTMTMMQMHVVSRVTRRSPVRFPDVLVQLICTFVCKEFKRVMSHFSDIEREREVRQSSRREREREGRYYSERGRERGVHCTILTSLYSIQTLAAQMQNIQL